mgnify:CR=1 FL=1
MKILYLHTTDWPSASPGANFVTYYTEALARIGVHTELVVQKATGSPPVPEVLRDFYGLEPNPHWTISALEVQGRRSGERRRNFYAKLAGMLRQRRTAPRPDAVITRSLSILSLLVRLRGDLGNPRLFFESHDCYAAFVRAREKGFQGLKNFVRERALIPKIDGVVCLQKTQLGLYRQYFPGTRFFHLPSGCRFFGRRDEKQGPFTAVYVGSFDKHKGVEDVLEIWRDWKDAPRLLLLGARTPSEGEEMEKRVKALGTGGPVIVAPWQKPSALPGWLARAHVGLLPLRDTFFNRYLTFPLKLMDYVAAGLPVVARRLPTIENILENGKHGILLPDLHPGVVREAFATLRDKAMYAQIQSNVKGLAQDLSWIKRAEKTLECIDRAA